jgi:hypothetical protein
VRLNAAMALGKLRDSLAVAPLAKCLHDSQYGVRGTAIEALGRIGDPEAVLPLIQYYRETEGHRRFVKKETWDSMVQRWRERGDLRELILFLKLDVTKEPIVKSIIRVLESIDAGHSGTRGQLST